jgi:hypothetical protein
LTVGQTTIRLYGIDVLLAAGKDPHFLGDSMKMKELTPLVMRIMNNMSDARGNDDLLYSCVLRCLGANLDVSACEFFRTYRKAGYPTMETVGRLRRMIQADYPELRADESTTNRRKKQEEEIHEFFKKE